MVDHSMLTGIKCGTVYINKHLCEVVIKFLGFTGFYKFKISKWQPDVT